MNNEIIFHFQWTNYMLRLHKREYHTFSLYSEADYLFLGESTHIAKGGFSNNWVAYSWSVQPYITATHILRSPVIQFGAKVDRSKKLKNSLGFPCLDLLWCSGVSSASLQNLLSQFALSLRFDICLFKPHWPIKGLVSILMPFRLSARASAESGTVGVN